MVPSQYFVSQQFGEETIMFYCIVIPTNHTSTLSSIPFVSQPLILNGLHEMEFNSSGPMWWHANCGYVPIPAAMIHNDAFSTSTCLRIISPCSPRQLRSWWNWHKNNTSISTNILFLHRTMTHLSISIITLYNRQPSLDASQAAIDGSSIWQSWNAWVIAHIARQMYRITYQSSVPLQTASTLDPTRHDAKHS